MFKKLVSLTFSIILISYFNQIQTEAVAFSISNIFGNTETTKVIDYSDPDFKVTKPYVSINHSFNIEKVVITPDGKYALSAGGDYDIKLWDIKTGKNIRTFVGHTRSIISIKIISNGKHILSGSYDSTMKLWDIRTGKLIKTFNGHSRVLTGISVMKDDTYAFSVGASDINKKLQGEVIYWNLKTGKKLRKYNISLEGLNNVQIDANDKYFFVNAPGHKIKMVNIETGEENKIFSGHTNHVGYIKIFNDNKQLLTGSSDGSIKIWDIDNAEAVQTLEGHKSRITDMVLLKDNEELLSLSIDGIILWDLESGKQIKEFKRDRGEYGHCLALYPNENYALLGVNEKLYKLDINNDTNYGKELNIAMVNPAIVRSVGFSPDNRSVIVSNRSVFGRDNKRIYAGLVYTMDSGLFGNIKKYKDLQGEVLITKDMKYILSTSLYKILLSDIKSGKKIKEFIGHTNSITSITTNSDGRYLISASDDMTIKLWDIKSGKIIDSFIVDTKKDSSSIDTLKVSSDDKYLVSVSSDKNIKLWDIKTAKEINTRIYSHNIRSIDITTDNKYVIVAGWNNNIDILDLKTFKFIKSFKGHTNYLYHIQISSDNKYLFSASNDRTIKQWDIQSGELIKTFKGHSSGVKGFDLSGNGEYLISYDKGGVIKYWSIKEAKELLSIISFEDGSSISITPEGYFDTTASGTKHLNILTNTMEISTIDQYYEIFYRPDIVSESISGINENFNYAYKESSLELKAKPIIKTVKAKSEQMPRLKISEIKPAQKVAIIDTKENIDKEELKVTLKITPNSGGIGQIRLYLDDVLIKTDGDRGLKKAQDKNIVLKTYTIKLTKGKHSIKAIVYNEQNTMASSEEILAVISTYNPIIKPNIYAVVVGINEYKNPSIALKYAVDDAKLFAKTIKQRTKHLYGEVDIRLLTSKDATSKENITKALKDMQNISPNDLFIFFVASHGMIEEARYHMITSNVGALSSRGIKKEAINQETLRDLIANIPTTKKFIILDTCNSGKLGKTLEVAFLTRGLTETTAMKVLSRAVGSTIISASSSSQEALEGYNGHGLLTYVLADGLNGKADADNDGYIKTLEIANFVEDRVPEIAEKVFKRAQYPYISPLGQGFPLVKIK
ncbi:WD-40 repeat protein containing caspase catalyti c domain [Sulfurimonas gotlandica GD1]|uniref:WD-40 repeat protein containing caspase catalyti c domain n=1 Tax=Sulfurimonas gotlandica (strain DSM 19862 / JCM 16533 / GD1) TaxID=929558 RepID=B6BJM5_SULGG|nr:caspase family protein [Sulfurimonas gotlandica]EDZ62550.1 hypothetical protein CBGD1_2117 [Sulfurimonas gotlandica GD1]EHP31270.1 WD-40 repeat protein containing caspase catalyti c domain [Sulfurimonas gotlandica GD1]